MSTNISSVNNSKNTAAGGTFHTKAHPPASGDAKLVAAIAGTKPATTSAATVPYRERYKIMHVGVGVPGAANYVKWEKLMEIAAKHRVKESDVVWAALDMLLENTPDTIQGSERGAKGTSSGFWIVPVRNGEGRATGFQVVEVETRAELSKTGTTFFKYDEGDVKSRRRARRQALLKADQDRLLCGLAGVKVEVIEFENAETDAPGTTVEQVVSKVLEEDGEGDTDGDDEGQAIGEDPDTDA